MKLIRTSLLLGSALFSLLPSLASAATASPVQATARPLGLSIAGPVEAASSDAAAQAFQTGTLPSVLNLVNTQLGETKYLPNASAMALDPSKLKLALDATARVYFIAEGAGYHNTLGFNTLPSGAAMPARGLTDTAKIIFPDASSSISAYNASGSGRRTASEPLLAGDFVDLGHFSSGSTLDFFIVSNGANGGSNVLTSSASRNPDNINHVVAFAVKDSPYLIIAFEDLLGGGDRDYNDVVMALDIGYENVQRLISAPEPATWLVLASFLGLVIYRKRRQSAAAVPQMAAA